MEKTESGREGHAETLRPAELRDIPAICELVNSAYRGESSKRGWTTEADLLGGQRTDPGTLRVSLLAEGNVVLLLHDGGELIGCVFLQRKVDCAYLGMLTIKPDLQARGIGRRLLEGAERWARENWDARRIEMCVITQREELIAWYERRGYRRTGRTELFPYGDSRYGLPKRNDLKFETLEKDLAEPASKY